MAGKEPARSSETLLQERKKIISNLVLGLAAVFVVLLALGTMAWFASNKDVNGVGLEISMDSDLWPFELRTKGNDVGPRSHELTLDNEKNIIEEVITSLYAKDTSKTEETEYVTGAFVNGEGYYTDGDHPRIQWNLEGTENEKGLEPGSHGVFTFWVVPKRDGDMTITFHLAVDGYTARQTKNIINNTYNVTSVMPVTEESNQKKKDAVKYLNGHILFFLEREVVGGTQEDPVYSYNNLIEDVSEFVLSFPRGGDYETAVEAGEEMEVNLYWVWPHTFGEMVFSAQENNNHQPLTTDDATRTALRKYLVDNFDKVFIQGTAEDDVDLFPAMTTVTLDDENQVVYQFNGNVSQNEKVYEAISLGYNRGDSVIGSNLQYALISLMAEN